jgi:hypothetical protein
MPSADATPKIGSGLAGKQRDAEQHYRNRAKDNDREKELAVIHA